MFIRSIHVVDFDRSLSFYADGVGLPIILVRDRGAGVRSATLGGREGQLLEIIGDGRAVPTEGGKSIMYTLDDAAGTASRLDPDHEGPVITRSGLTFYVIHDPDGFEVKLLEPRGPGVTGDIHELMGLQ